MKHSFNWELCIIALSIVIAYGIENWLYKILCVAVGIGIFSLVIYLKEKFEKGKKD